MMVTYWEDIDFPLIIRTTGTAPTGNVFASMLQAHVECDSPGSAGMTTK